MLGYSNNEKEKLFIKYSENNIKCGSSEFLGSKMDLTYFKPQLNSNQFWFGHRIVPLNIGYIN